MVGIESWNRNDTDSYDGGSPELLMIRGRVHLDRFC